MNQYISENQYSLALGGSSHALPSRVGWSDDSSGDPPAAQQPKAKAKGRAKGKAKAKKTEPAEDDPNPILDGEDTDNDDDDVDPLGGDDEAPSEPVRKKPAKRDVKKRPAGGGRSTKSSKQSKDRDGMGT